MMLCLKSIHLQQLRLFRDLKVELQPGLQFFQGANGSGKTCLLEAIFWLATGKSFRSTRIDHLISDDQQQVSVQAQLCHNETVPEQTMLMLKKRDISQRSFLDGICISKKSEWINKLPVHYFGQEHYQMLTASPSLRRNWFCWLACYVCPNYLNNWQSYQYALKQRNVLLRQDGADSLLLSWESQLAKYAGLLVEDHERVGMSLQACLRKELDYWQLQWPLVWRFDHGGLENPDDPQQWQAQRNYDRLIGYSSKGPHRLDWQFSLNGSAARERLSTGQQKVLVSCLFLVRYQMLLELGKESLLLIDDLVAELDNDFSTQFITRLKVLPGQILVTMLDRVAHLVGNLDAPLWRIEQQQLFAIG